MSKNIPFEKIYEQIKNQFPNIVIDKDSYIDTKHKCHCKCLDCGHEWTPNVRDLIRGHACPNCAIIAYKKRTFDAFAKLIEQKFNGRYIVEFKDYVTKLDKMKIYDKILKKYIFVTPKSLESKRIPTEHTKFLAHKTEKINKFLRRANDKFKGNFQYPNINEEYENKHSIITIYCTKHQKQFQIKASTHLKSDFGSCKDCYNEWFLENKKISLEKWIDRCNKIHNFKYDYSEVIKLGDNFNYNEEVPIVCPKHGLYKQLASSHYRGKGCSKCAYKTVANKRRITEEKFLIKANKVHNNFYKYENYKSLLEEVTVICPIHGKYQQIARDHLQGCGCPKCGIERARRSRMWTTEQAIEKAKEVHGNKYDYSDIRYNGMSNYIYPICPIHGQFKQYAVTHIMQGCGCPKCSESHLEREIRIALEKNNIDYIYEQTFDWLKYKKNMSLDFYLPNYNIAIECQGQQHFQGGWLINEEESKLIRARDEVKRSQCLENGVDLIYFLGDRYKEFTKDLSNRCFTKEQDLIEYIKSK